MAGEKLISTDSAGARKEQTPAQVRTLINVEDGADATGFAGNLTTAQRDALTPSAGWWCRNTEWNYRFEIFDGDIWIPDGAERFVNKTGENSVRGKTVQVNSGVSVSVQLTNQLDDEETIGVIYTAGVADGGPIAVFTGVGKIVEYLMQANDNTGNGQWIVARNGGVSVSVSDTRTGNCGIALESKDDTVPFLVKGFLGVFAETV